MPCLLASLTRPPTAAAQVARLAAELQAARGSEAALEARYQQARASELEARSMLQRMLQLGPLLPATAPQRQSAFHAYSQQSQRQQQVHWEEMRREQQQMAMQQQQPRSPQRPPMQQWQQPQQPMQQQQQHMQTQQHRPALLLRQDQQLQRQPEHPEQGQLTPRQQQRLQQLQQAQHWQAPQPVAAWPFEVHVEVRPPLQLQLNGAHLPQGAAGPRTTPPPGVQSRQQSLAGMHLPTPAQQQQGLPRQQPPQRPLLPAQPSMQQQRPARAAPPLLPLPHTFAGGSPRGHAPGPLLPSLQAQHLGPSAMQPAGLGASPRPSPAVSPRAMTGVGAAGLFAPLPVTTGLPAVPAMRPAARPAAPLSPRAPVGLPMYAAAGAQQAARPVAHPGPAADGGGFSWGASGVQASAAASRTTTPPF